MIDSEGASRGASAGQRSSGAPASKLWRSVEELAEPALPREASGEEFPPGFFEGLSQHPVSRRDFLKAVAVSSALAGAAGCARQPSEEIVPYVHGTTEVTPGIPLFFATALTRNGYALGVRVESHMGRPTKVEGNPHHPASLGATDIFAQGAIFDLYDPDRSRAVLHGNDVSPWQTARDDLQQTLASGHGEGVRVLTGPFTSPTMQHWMRRVLTRLPEARWHAYEPIDEDHRRAGAQAVLGRPLDAIYDLGKADVIVSLDADLLFEEAGSVRYARDFADRRRMRVHDRQVTPGRMNRLYVIEPTPTITGSSADHRLRLAASRIGTFAAALAKAVGVPVARDHIEGLEDKAKHWTSVIAADLLAHRGRTLVAAGRSQPPAVHALIFAINAALGNVGKALAFIVPPTLGEAGTPGTLPRLAADMHAGKVQTLVILDRNPVYDAPADLDFTAALANVRQVIHLGRYRDETAMHSDWHVPMTHELETWGDALAYDGTATVMQPLIAPLYDGRSPLEMLAVLAGEIDLTPHDMVRAHWRKAVGEDGFGSWWRAMLKRGTVNGRGVKPVSVKIDPGKAAKAVGRALLHPPTTASSEHPKDLELAFRPDPTLWDGRFANNRWLQELPKPITKLTWDNAVLISPATAGRLGVQSESMVELRVGERRLRAAAWIAPGQADETLVLSLGYGRGEAGGAGGGTGFNAYQLRTSDAPWLAAHATVAVVAGAYPLATTQRHRTMEGRDLVRMGTLSDFQRQPASIVHEQPAARTIALSLYPEYDYSTGQQWGMTIDLSTCIGCSACVIACQAENNIPSVGKEEVLAQRAMHWIRIDRYYEGSKDEPALYHQPVPCMHCELAPCELVCPVGATQHSIDGINEMVYNRCIGTRYCSNNCPYKVRRFNFYRYANVSNASYKLMRNPDVSVRGRGVMEKCTYCIQRIRSAQITANIENRTVHDHEILTACQQVCPTHAIEFGDINDDHSGVHADKQQPHNYGLLTELNTKPRTTYLGGVRNMNPKMTEHQV